MPRGGVRDGAGGPRGPRKKLASSHYAEPKTPLQYMLGVMNDLEATQARRDRMAIAAAGYVHPKQGEDGKKIQRGKAAHIAGRGKFAPAAAPPRLVVCEAAGQVKAIVELFSASRDACTTKRAGLSSLIADYGTTHALDPEAPAA